MCLGLQFIEDMFYVRQEAISAYMSQAETTIKNSQ